MDIITIAKRVLTGDVREGDAETLADYIIRMEQDYKQQLLGRLGVAAKIMGVDPTRPTAPESEAE